MSDIKPGRIVRVRLSDHMTSLGPWTHGVVIAVGAKHPVHGWAVRVALDPDGPKEGGVPGYNEVTRYTGASRFDAVNLNIGQATIMRLTRIYESAMPSLSTQQCTGDASMLKKYQAPEIQTVALRAQKHGAFSKLDGQRLAAILEHPDVIHAVKESFEGASTAALEDAKRMLSSCQNELESTRQNNEELYQKLVDLTRRHDKLVEAHNEAGAKLRATKPVLPVQEDQILFLAGEKRGFILWNPSSTIAPRVIYRTLGEAKSVQEQMAAKHQNETFYIMPIGPGLKIVKPVAAQRVVC